MTTSGDGVIRVGIVGAGGNSRARHIPGFQAIDGVELVGVANRSRESGQRAADEFGISTVFDDWRDMVEDPDIDAICIGTWPYLHAPVAIEALEYGKHVLVEARMAMDATEARAMLDVSLRNPSLVAQVVPSPFTFRVDRTIEDLVADDYLGSVTAVEARVLNSTFPDFNGPFHWRNDRDLSGFNILGMGIWYEALMRWVGPATQVTAMSQVTVSERRDADSRLRTVSIPDHVDVLYRLARGGQVHLSLSAVTGLGPPGDVWLFGTEGTLRLEVNGLKLSGGKRGDEALTEIEIPTEKRGSWRVEEEFINAIRGVKPVRYTTFPDGVAYMEFTEAVTRSAQTGQAVGLPL
jgi:predicted dehydrogenase